MVISRRRSPGGDSDFDYSDDDDGIALLKDDLRTTTERFFERLPRQRQGQEEKGVRPRRRASGFVSAGTSPGAGGGVGVQGRSGGGSPQPSWNALEQLEKGVGGMMRRHTGTALKGLKPLDGGGGDIDGGGGVAAAGVNGFESLPSPGGNDPFIVGGLGAQRGHGDSSIPALHPSSTGGGGGNTAAAPAPRFQQGVRERTQGSFRGSGQDSSRSESIAGRRGRQWR